MTGISSFESKMPMPRLRYKGKRKTYANAHLQNAYDQDWNEELLADPQEVFAVAIDWSTKMIRFSVKKRPEACHYYSKKSLMEKKPQTECLMIKFEDFDDELEFIQDA